MLLSALLLTLAPTTPQDPAKLSEQYVALCKAKDEKGLSELWLANVGLSRLVVVPISFNLITLGPRYLPAAEVGLLMLLETVLGPLWVWLVIDEYPGDLAMAGGALVVATLAGHAIASGRRRRVAVP